MVKNNKFFKKHVFTILSSIFGIVFILFSNSCANPGSGPGGGPRDTIAPVIVNMIPQPYETNFSGNEITFTFN